MSYDISFWKPRPGSTTPPEEIYRRVSPEELLDELETLPVETINHALRRAFPSYDESEDPPLVELPGGSMEVWQGPQCFRFDFRGPETGGAKAAVWRVMSGFGCVCYDPQANELYTTDHPPECRALTPEEAKKVEAEFGGRDAEMMMRRLDQQRAVRTIVGCGLLIAVGTLFAAGVVATIVAFLV